MLSLLKINAVDSEGTFLFFAEFMYPHSFGKSELILEVPMGNFYPEKSTQILHRFFPESHRALTQKSV
jgi:hypothetical protein